MMNYQDACKILTQGAYFEITQLANINKITAIDPITGTEIIMGFPKQSKIADIQKLAMVKLAMRISKVKKQP